MTRLMTYNIQEGGGSDRRFARLVEVIERASPDVLVVNEGAGWHPAHERAERIADCLGAEHRIAHTGSGFDLAFFSRLPILGLEEPDADSLFHGLAWIEVRTPDGGDLVVAGLHLDFREEWRRREEVDSILPLLAPLLERPAAVLGDLNALDPDDRVMGLRPDELAQTDLDEMPDWFLKRYPPEALPRLLAAGWRDAFRTCHPGATGYTMSTEDPNARYDYVLASPPLIGRVREVWVETAPPVTNASDHFPVIAEID
jgi:endonuclease/exonuclease/phosphatase family metal-dependent hydrolase